MSEETQPLSLRRLTPGQRDNLVAYLDGELEPEDRQELEAVLARSQTARRDVETLTRTWEMLSLLPHPRVDRSFVTQTLHRIETDRLRGQIRRSRWVSKGRGLVLSLGWIPLLVGAAALGYAAVGHWSAARRDDLPLIQNLDAYREVRDLEFLKALHQSAIFAREANPNEPVTQ